MITAKIGEIIKDRTTAKVQVHILKDGELNIIEEVVLRPNLTLEDIKKQVKRRIDEVTAVHNLADTLAKDTVIDAPLNTPPTQAEVDKQTFLEDYRKWVKVKQAIDIGILTGNEAPVVALLNKVKAAFKPEYLDIL